MRAKRAKELRAWAREQTAGEANVAYQRNRHTGVIELVPLCTRHLYQAVKRAYKLRMQGKREL